MRGKRAPAACSASSSGLDPKPQPSSKAAPDSNVLDDAGASFRRTLSRDMHEKAARACKQHCKFVPKAILEHKEVDGMLLRDRVLHDMQAKVPGQRLGAKYWSAIIALYTADTTPASDLAPERTDEAVNDALVDAVSKMHEDNPALRTNRNIINFLGTAAPFNQTEWIGMVRVMSDPRIERLRSHDELMMEWMKFAARTDAAKAFPKELAACKTLFDRALTHHWVGLKKSAVKLSTFLDIHVDVCALLMDRTDLLAVIASKTDLKAVRKQVCRLHDSCLCGKTMFADHIMQFTSSDFSERISNIVSEAFAGTGAIDDAAIASCKRSCMDVAASANRGKKLHGKRSIELSFLASDISVQVSSPEEEIELKIGAAIKNMTIGRKNGIPMLSYEVWVRPNIGADERDVPRNALVGSIAARRVVAELIADDQIASFAEVARIIVARSSSVLVLDRTFRLELCFLDQAEVLIGKAIEHEILSACLPNPLDAKSGPATLEQAILAITTLRGHDMVKRSNASCIGKLESVQLLLLHMQRGVSPDAATNMSGFFVTVLERCSLFFTYGAGEAMTRGTTAIQSYCKKLDDKANEGIVVEVPEIEALRPFWWLLSRVQIEQIQAHLRNAITSATEGGRSSGCTTSHEAPSKTKVGDAKRKQATGGAEQAEKKAKVLKLFGK